MSPSTARVQRSAQRLVARRWAWVAGAFVLGVAALPGTSGCNLVNPPQPEPTPTPVPTPVADLFDPADGVAPLTSINDNDPNNPLLPEKYRVVGVVNAEVLLVQSLVGPPEKRQVSGPGDPVRLAGIVAPAPNQPGYAETVRFITERTLGKEVDIEQDPRFPIDLDGRRMVQVYYTNTGGKLADQKLLLNRMMVRQGVAVVDLNAPTIIDVRAWLNDEEFAREKRLGLNKFGITLAQRIPLTPPTSVLRSPAQRIPAAPRPPGSRAATSASSTTTTTASTSTSASSGPPPGASNSASPSASSVAPTTPGSTTPGASGGASNSTSAGASNSASP